MNGLDIYTLKVLYQQVHSYEDKQWIGFLISKLEQRLNIPVRNKDEVALARPNDITLEEAFNIAFERYEDALEELAKK